MNKTSIEFCDFTSNPLRGCQIGCVYCWARKFNNRYFKDNFSVPKFFPERLNESVPKIPEDRNYIAKAISPEKPVVFMVDMGDIFSPGVQAAWIEKIFKYVDDHPKANFLFLTKRPILYKAWFNQIPKKNTILGTSIDYAHNSISRLDSLRVVSAAGYMTFVNLEPLMSRMDHADFSLIDFIVVGALTGSKYRPEKGWHESIKHDIIYYKNNYLKYFPELKNK